MALTIKNLAGTSEVDWSLDLAQETLQHIKPSVVLLQVNNDLSLADAIYKFSNNLRR